MPENEARAVPARLDLHLYAERLDRHADRCAEDLADARMLVAWCDIDDRLRNALPADRVTRLTGCGLIAAPDRREVAQRSVIEREADLAAIHAAQLVIREMLAAEKRPATPDRLVRGACPKCGGKGCEVPWARNLTRCNKCNGTGNAPGADPEYYSVVMIVDVSNPEGDAFLHNVAESTEGVVHISAFSATEDSGGEIDALRWLGGMGNVHREQAAADLADYETEM